VGTKSRPENVPRPSSNSYPRRGDLRDAAGQPQSVPHVSLEAPGWGVTFGVANSPGAGVGGRPRGRGRSPGRPGRLSSKEIDEPAFVDEGDRRESPPRGAAHESSRRSARLRSRMPPRPTRTGWHQQARPPPQDEMSRGSPKLAAQPLEHLVARNGFNFSSLDLSGSMLDLDSPRLLYVGVGWPVKRFDKSESQLCPFPFRELSRPFLELGKNVRHTPPPPFVSPSTRQGLSPPGGRRGHRRTLSPSPMPSRACPG
jgi:hypothetical protein